MKRAVELLDVIEASHLPVTDRLEQHRRDLVSRMEERFNRADDRASQMAAELAALLVQEGVVLSDQQSLEEVIAEYLHVIADEQAALGDEEKNFLDSFLG